jgi:hypothetical protein
MDILKLYSNIQEKLETLITIYVYDIKRDDFLKKIQDQHLSALKINNPVKKYKLNNRYYDFLKYIEINYNEDDFINSIFLIDDKIFEYKLLNNDIKNAKEYNFIKFYLNNDIIFNINYLIDLFNNFDFIYTIKLHRNEFEIIKINKNKEKKIFDIKISSDVQIIENIEKIRKDYNYKDLIIIYGISNYLKSDNLEKIKNILIIKEILNRSVLYSYYQDEIMKKNHNELEKRLIDMQNAKTNIDLYIFGKLKIEIKDAIETYSIKELYIEDRKLELLKQFIDNDLLNFKIYPIKSLKNGDIAEQFIKDYNGIMGIKYF